MNINEYLQLYVLWVSIYKIPLLKIKILWCLSYSVLNQGSLKMQCNVNKLGCSNFDWVMESMHKEDCISNLYRLYLL